MNKFMFDRVFDPVTSQKEIYDVAAKSIIDSTYLMGVLNFIRCIGGIQWNYLCIWVDILR